MIKPVLDISTSDGNAFSLLAKARKVATRNDMNWQEIHAEATGGDYDHLIQTLMKHFEVTV